MDGLICASVSIEDSGRDDILALLNIPKFDQYTYLKS